MTKWEVYIGVLAIYFKYLQGNIRHVQASYRCTDKCQANNGELTFGGKCKAFTSMLTAFVTKWQANMTVTLFSHIPNMAVPTEEEKCAANYHWNAFFPEIQLPSYVIMLVIQCPS